MLIARLVVLLVAVLASACGKTALSPLLQEENEALISSVVLDGWKAAGFDAPGGRCALGSFQISRPDTEEEYHRSCPLKSNACFKWVLRDKEPFHDQLRYPLAIMRPDEMFDEATYMRLAIHELLHGLTDCELARAWEDPYDAGHEDPSVWLSACGDSPCTTSAEFYAQESLLSFKPLMVVQYVSEER
jgi:hypothetical protein